MSGIRWKFVCIENNASIVVHDEASYNALTAVLTQGKNGPEYGKWRVSKIESVVVPPFVPRLVAPPTAPPVALAVAPPAVKPQQERRRHARFSYEYRVIVVTGMKSFRTTCTDISLGGMRLKHMLPSQLHGQTCRVFVGGPHTNESIELTCKVDSTPGSMTRISFTQTEGESESIKTLEKWLNSHSQPVSIQKAA